MDLECGDKSTVRKWWVVVGVGRRGVNHLAIALLRTQEGPAKETGSM